MPSELSKLFSTSEDIFSRQVGVSVNSTQQLVKFTNVNQQGMWEFWLPYLPIKQWMFSINIFGIRAKMNNI